MAEIMSAGDRPKQEGEVMNSNVHNSGVSRAHARAYAVCSDDSQTIRQTRVLKEPISARPRARTRGVRLLAKFRAWRIKTFGGDIDSVRVAVEEAVAAFSSGKSSSSRGACGGVNLVLVVWRVGDGLIVYGFGVGGWRSWIQGAGRRIARREKSTGTFDPNS